ncbi:MAG: glycosyl transferase family 2 [Pelagibacteraceae bacterium]|nr:glycosyl transferase family 2 [Pelagibacteraceae bacterium]|tara:strand:- start:1464 stop:2264 length:801 start_codon:yes stop_codon:yes gene_type:complete
MTKENTSYPLVSIIMNCHNGQEFLEEAIKSVLSQKYQNWELIFWDNFSTDNSKKILQEFSDERIKYFKSNKFTNLYEARNLAIEKSKGEYIGFLDTDDLWATDKLQKQIDFFKKNKEFKIVYSNYYILEDRKNKKYIKHKNPLPSGSITQKLLNHYSLGVLTVLLKKTIFDKFKFNNTYNIIGDFDFFIILSQIFEIASIQEPIASYRVHSSNYSSKKIKTYIDELKYWFKINEKQLKEKGFNINQQKFLLFKLRIKFFLRNFFKF